MVWATKNGMGVLLFVKCTYFLISGYYILAIIIAILSKTKLIFWSRSEGEENGEKMLLKHFRTKS